VPDTKARQFIEHTIGVPIHQFADLRDYTEIGCKRVWASFRACHLTASIFLSTDFHVVGKTSRVLAESPELDRLMSTPNPFDTWEEMLYQWVFHMKLTGCAYWLKDEPDYMGRPKNIYPLIPQYVSVVPHPTYKVSH
jgi:hypothetical protein